MMSSIDTGKAALGTVWQRLTANRWTVIFVVALLVQAIAQAIVQFEAYQANKFGHDVLQSLQRALPEKQQQEEAQEATSSRTADDEATMSASASMSQTLDMQNNAAMGLPSQQAKVELDMEEVEEAEEEEEEAEDESESESDDSDSESSDEESDEEDEEEEEEEEDEATAAPVAPSTTRTGITPASSPTRLQASFFSAATPTATIPRNGPAATIGDTSSNVRRMRHRRGVTPALRHRRRQLLEFAPGPAQYDSQLTISKVEEPSVASEAAQASASAAPSEPAALASNRAFESPIPFDVPSASPLLIKRHAKRQSFPVAGVTTNLVANDTIEVSGLGKDPNAEPIEIDRECTDALAIPLLAIERQGVQALALAAFDFWLFLLALFGVYHQSVPHVLATWVSKAAAVGWSGFQVSSVQSFHQIFTENVTQGACAGASVLPNYWDKVEDLSVAGLVLEAVFFVLITAFLWQIYRVIQWQSFREIGADRKMARRNKLHMVHSVVCFTAAFFLLAFFALILNEIVASDRPLYFKEQLEADGIQDGFVALVIVATLMVPTWLVVGGMAVTKHKLKWLIAFVPPAILLLVTIILLLDRAPGSSQLLLSWKFLLFLAVMSLIGFVTVCVATSLTYAYDCKHNPKTEDKPLEEGFEWSVKPAQPDDSKHQVDFPADPEPYSPEKEVQPEPEHVEVRTQDSTPAYNSLFAPQPASQQQTPSPAPAASKPAAAPAPSLAQMIQNDQGIPDASLGMPQRTSSKRDTTSTAVSAAQELEIPSSYARSDVPILQAPKRGRNEVSRWSATATSADLSRSSWIAGDDRRSLGASSRG